MIEIERHGRTAKFDDTGYDPEQPGRIREVLLSGAFYEEDFLEHIRSLGRSGTYVDVGAYIGTHSVYFAVMCDAERVYAFEPREGPRAELERNLRANQIETRVTVVPYGAADRASEQTIRGHLLKRAEDAQVECVTLDDTIEGSVAVIKIDVEGMELEVLRGAQRILRETRPTIFAEAHDEALREEIGAFLSELGYAPTGRIFNRSPTYEFVHASRLHLELRRENEALRHELESLRRALRSARRSLSFRLGRATRVALREKGKPWEIPARWLRAFSGPDEVLERHGRGPGAVAATE